MTSKGAIFWRATWPYLDDEFDAHDAVADHELCQAIAAGKRGLHPDAWGNHDPLALLPPSFRRWASLTPHRMIPIGPVRPDPEPEWEAKHRRRPVEEPPPPIFMGEIELTCDECDRQFGTVKYGRGQREAMAAGLWALGAQRGWTHIDGRDRCPDCSSGTPAPEDVGNGAGERQGDKQHAKGG